MIGIALYGKKKFLSSVNTFKSNFFNSPSVEKASTRSHSLLTNAVYRGEPSIGITDDKNFFLPYNAIPIINQRIKDECPEIIELVNQLQNYLNEEVMVDLNYKVDEEKQKTKDVAYNFLLENNLIK